METITLLRFSAAKSRKAILAEIATGASRDHGTGHTFEGLSCAVEAEQDISTLESPVPVAVREWGKHDASGAVCDAAGLRSYLATQGAGKGRVMWRLTVRREDVIGWATRECGYPNILYVSDGVILRCGAVAVAVERI